ncbi:MAG: membrane protein [Sulfuricurvum sp. MLSB]|uniref:DedA family protein n=1 Tax=Sulfuricurvum sp. MLSB TaxID=1537917 RepID=UPI000505CB17|nr:DedA family protein [Sulfuricurvum sp. MLSB]KFN39537.1 MAG: membrane protein [Sulfuricurvum sp. MLSB]
MLAELTGWLVDTVAGLGYAGIVALMAVESSFIPFPSEVVMIPAGYLAAQGKMDISLVIFSGLVGSMIGAYINYFGALWIGRRFLERYGRYFFISQKTLEKMDVFFERHGAVSTFIGRLIPGVRQLISVPAGLARMNLALFSAYTALGAGLWGAILALLGYFIGGNEALIAEYLHEITITLAAGAVAIIAAYVWFMKKEAETDA